MKFLGQPTALSIAGGLLLLLAIGPPLVWLQARSAAHDANTDTDTRAPYATNPAAEYVSMLSRSHSLRAALRGREVIGYATQSEIDVRSDGDGQARYYLSQFALAPVLVELGSSSRSNSISEKKPPSQDRDLVLAVFELPWQLHQYLDQHERIAMVSLSASIALTRPKQR